MRPFFSRALCASTALASGVLASTAVLAQSTGTAVVEELIVTASTGPRDQVHAEF